MRILHTSDWHLGQHFMGMTRQAEHAAFCEWLIDQVKAHQVDAVVIAGDIFDTGAPPSYAREQYNRFVVALKQTGAELVVLGGNHDSVAMLNESKTLLGYIGAHVVANAGSTDEPLVLHTRSGKPGAVICAIPFIRPRDVLVSEAGQSAQTKQQLLQRAIEAHYQMLYQKAQAKVSELGGELPIIATGHLTTVGASASESVREIYVGSLEAFPTQAFVPADYIALGHIHRSQKVGGLNHIRYSGSPIALSFDEAKQQKQVLLVDIEVGSALVTECCVPCFQPMASVKGNLKELAQALRALDQENTSDNSLWVEVTVQGDDYLSDLHQRLNELSQGLRVEILRVKRERRMSASQMDIASSQTLDELDPMQVFTRRLEAEALEEELADSLSQLHQEVLNELSAPEGHA